MTALEVQNEAFNLKIARAERGNGQSVRTIFTGRDDGKQRSSYGKNMETVFQTKKVCGSAKAKRMALG